MSRKFPIWIGAILIVAALLLSFGYRNLKRVQNLEALEQSIALEFPDVEHISTQSLANLLQNEPDDLLLIDCRNPEEYAISHIPGALNLGDVDAVRDTIGQRENPPREIAVYCSVGYRSAKLARALEEAGLENAVNVRGSIFAWANEDRPLETPGGEATEKVHPFNQFWGRLLNEGKQASLKDPASLEDKNE